MFAIEHSGVIPDLMTTAKSMAGGFPLAAVTGKAETMDAANPGGLGGTYAGNPLACAAANAVLDVMEEENMLELSNELGRKLKDKLGQLAKRNSNRCIDNIRGLGAMVAMDIVNDKGESDGQTAGRLTRQALDDGLVVLSCGVNGNVIRFLMPLNISDNLLDEGLKRLENSLSKVSSAA